MALKRATRFVKRWAAWQPTPRQQLGAILVLVALMSVGLWRVETTSRAVGNIDRKRAESQCQGARAERANNEALLLDILNDLGARQTVIDVVKDNYDARPPPASCVAVDVGS